MLADADLAAVGRMLGDGHRAEFLLALLGGDELSAGELASRSGASSSLASAHLSKLLQAGMLSVRRDGRQRYYRIDNPQLAQAIEALLAIAPPRRARALRESKHGQAIQRARTCYDHLAGELGVALTDALEHKQFITPWANGWELTPEGQRQFEDLGLDIDSIRRLRRAFARPCLDWTERRPHLAGALGAAVTSRLLDMGWLRRLPDTRAVRLTPPGRTKLRETFGIELAS